MTNKILIIGATSAIAQDIARLYANANNELFLVARNSLRLESMISDLRLRSNSYIHSHVLDLNEFDKHHELFKKVTEKWTNIDILLVAHGTLPNQKKCEASFAETYNAMSTNCLSVISLLTLFANYFELQKKGCIAVITSVAGDRGRKSNYVYGMAKGSLTIFLQGLRNRLVQSNVQVLTIKPGFVDTPMTKHFKKNILWSTPERVAAKIVKAIAQKRSSIYVPFFWRYIMFIIKSLPERILSKLSL